MNEKLRNILGCINIENDDLNYDNLGTILAAYFSNHKDKPENDPDHDSGYSEWAMEKTNKTLDEIIKTVVESFQEK